MLKIPILYLSSMLMDLTIFLFKLPNSMGCNKSL